jgi:formate hydrogenlyase subunit 6/NADH:ubiquinone oxidoreductase subunit I
MRFPGKMVGEVVKHVVKAPATEQYPYVKANIPPEFRGQIRYIAARCNGCKLCVKDCPSAAITINKVGDKRFEAVFDLSRCIYCGQCVDSCNRDSLEVSLAFELAQLDKKKFTVVFEADPAPAGSPASDEQPKPAAGDPKK